MSRAKISFYRPRTTQLLFGVLAAAMLLPVSKPVEASTANITISAVITIPACTINGGTDITIDFGNMDASQVNGTNNPITKPIPVVCPYPTSSTAYVKVIGTPMAGTELEGNILSTTGLNSTNLGVALYQGTSVDAANPLKLGIGAGNGYQITDPGWVNTAPTTFTMTAVLYKGSGTLVGGVVAATATMDITYL